MRILITSLVAMWGTGLASAAEPPAPPEPGPMVTVEVAIVEFSADDLTTREEKGVSGDSSETLIARIRELEKEGKLDSLTRVRLTSLEEQMATVQQGEQVAQPSGWARFRSDRSEGGFGGRDVPTAFSRESVGLHVSTTTRIADDGRILIELAVERSRLRPTRDRSVEVGPGGPSPQPTETLTVRSTLRVPDGGTVVAQSTEARAGNAKTQQVILVSARVDESNRKTAQAAEQESNVFRAFVLKQVAAASAVSLLKDLYRDRKELRFEADPRSQTVIVTGPRELLDEIGGLLQRIDEQPQEKAAPKTEG